MSFFQMIPAPDNHEDRGGIRADVGPVNVEFSKGFEKKAMAFADEDGANVVGNLAKDESDVTPSIAAVAYVQTPPRHSYAVYLRFSPSFLHITYLFKYSWPGVALPSMSVAVKETVNSLRVDISVGLMP